MSEKKSLRLLVFNKTFIEWVDCQIRGKIWAKMIEKIHQEQQKCDPFISERKFENFGGKFETEFPGETRNNILKIFFPFVGGRLESFQNLITNFDGWIFQLKFLEVFFHQLRENF